MSHTNVSLSVCVLVGRHLRGKRLPDPLFPSCTHSQEMSREHTILQFSVHIQQESTSFFPFLCQHIATNRVSDILAYVILIVDSYEPIGSLTSNCKKNVCRISSLCAVGRNKKKKGAHRCCKALTKVYVVPLLS